MHATDIDDCPSTGPAAGAETRGVVYANRTLGCEVSCMAYGLPPRRVPKSGHAGRLFADQKPSSLAVQAVAEPDACPPLHGRRRRVLPCVGIRADDLARRVGYDHESNRPADGDAPRDAVQT